MSMSAIWVAYWTISYREVRRFMRIWAQTILPPAITMSLYFVIFGISSDRAPDWDDGWP